MVELKVSIALGGDPYDQPRMDAIETLVRDRLADMLESDLRLIAKADPDNRERLRLAYPDHVAAYERWLVRGQAAGVS